MKNFDVEKNKGMSIITDHIESDLTVEDFRHLFSIANHGVMDGIYDVIEAAYYTGIATGVEIASRDLVKG